MRILFLSRWFPYPPDNGARIRIYNLLKGLASRHPVDLISFCDRLLGEEQLAGIAPLANVLASFEYRKFSPGRWKSLLGFFSPRPRSVIDTYRPELMQAVLDAQARNSYDVVIANEIDMAPYALVVTGAVKILEELEVTQIYDNYRRQSRLLPRLRSKLTWMKLARYAANLIHSFDGVTVVSDLEKAVVSTLAPDRETIRVIPNGVDCSYYRSYPRQAAEPRSLVYSGALTYQANFDAVAYFLGEIFPLIQARIPDVRFYITGRTDNVPLDQLPQSDGVVFTGYVNDIRAVLSRSCVNVVPLRHGGGTRLKILESLAIGTPVVSTRKGAEGLDLEDGQDIILADTPSAFAEAVIKLFNDSALRERLATHGKQTVQLKYDWSMISQSFLEAIQEWGQGKGRSS